MQYSTLCIVIVIKLWGIDRALWPGTNLKPDEIRGSKRTARSTPTYPMSGRVGYQALAASSREMGWNTCKFSHTFICIIPRVLITSAKGLHSMRFTEILFKKIDPHLRPRGGGYAQKASLFRLQAGGA